MDYIPALFVESLLTCLGQANTLKQLKRPFDALIKQFMKNKEAELVGIFYIELGAKDETPRFYAYKSMPSDVQGPLERWNYVVSSSTQLHTVIFAQRDPAKRIELLEYEDINFFIGRRHQENSFLSFIRRYGMPNNLCWYNLLLHHTSWVERSLRLRQYEDLKIYKCAWLVNGTTEISLTIAKHVKHITMITGNANLPTLILARLCVDGDEKSVRTFKICDGSDTFGLTAHFASFLSSLIRLRRRLYPLKLQVERTSQVTSRPQWGKGVQMKSAP